MTSLAVLALAVLLGQSAGSQPAVESPQARFDEATRLFDSGRYAEAAEGFRQLQEATGEEVLLYPMAQSLRLAGRCGAALEAYQRFVAAERLLKSKAEQAAGPSGMKRLPMDLAVARARIVEMRVCASRSQSEPARRAAFRRLAAGEPQEALSVLQQIWDERKDPTLLADMAEIERASGHCDQALRHLNLGVVELSPIETLGEDLGSDAALAIEGLRRTRAAKVDFRCTKAPEIEQSQQALRASPSAAMPSPPRPATAGQLEQIQTSPRGRKRWPIYTAIAGGVLAAGGVGSWVMMKRLETQVTDSFKPGNPNYQKGPELVEKGERYEKAGAVLFAAGMSTAAASLIYWFVAADRGGATPVVQLRPGGATVAYDARF